MGLLSILTLPLTAPIDGILFAMRTIQGEVDKQLSDPDFVRAQLAELQKQLDNGEITEEEFESQENDILDRLDLIYQSREGSENG